MSLDDTIYAGLDIAKGRRSATLALLDQDMKIFTLKRWSFAEAMSCLAEHERIVLGINSSLQGLKPFRKTIIRAGFKQLSAKSSRWWIETDSQLCFLSLCGNKLLSRRSLEGRLQRMLLLFEVRMQIPDPMDFFEEITRYKLLQGNIPVEKLFRYSELDALMAAYMAWLVGNDPTQTCIVGDNLLPNRESE